MSDKHEVNIIHVSDVIGGCAMILGVLAAVPLIFVAFPAAMVLGYSIYYGNAEVILVAVNSLFQSWCGSVVVIAFLVLVPCLAIALIVNKFRKSMGITHTIETVVADRIELTTYNVDNDMNTTNGGESTYVAITGKGSADASYIVFAKTRNGLTALAFSVNAPVYIKRDAPSGQAYIANYEEWITNRHHDAGKYGSYDEPLHMLKRMYTEIHIPSCSAPTFANALAI